MDGQCGWRGGGGKECNTVGSIIGHRAMLVNRSRSTILSIKKLAPYSNGHTK